MEGWKQRSKILVDQILAVDPYYVPSNECRFIGQASYADIAAGRTSPSSRNCSPYRQQRDATPPAATQVLRPAITRVQKPTVDCPSGETQRREATKTRAQRGDASNPDNKPKPRTEMHVQTVQDQIECAEDDRQDVPEVIVEATVRRGRSPTRKTGSPKMKEPSLAAREDEIDNNPQSSASLRQEVRAEIPAKNTLTPHEERRGRSPSPMWVPGSTTYADILRGCLQTTQVNVASPAEPPRQEMVSLSGESRRGRTEIPRVEQVPVEQADVTGNATETPRVTESPQPVAQSQKMENEQMTEAYCQSPVEIPAEKIDEQAYAKPGSADWTDKALEDYNVLQHHVKPYDDVARQPQPAEIYDYIIQEPELVGFIGSQLSYPVSSYVYVPSDGHHHHHHHHHHQQVQQQLDSINLNPYNNGAMAYAPEHYVAQTAYLSATEIYQPTQMQQQQQQQQCPANDVRCANSMLIQNVEKPVQMQVAGQPEVAIATEPTDKVEQEEPVSVSNVAEAPTTNKPEAKDTSPLINNETRSQTFSYAQILSQGLSPRVTPTRVVGKTSAVEHRSKERSYSPKDSLSSRELSPSQESKIFGRDSQQPLAKIEQAKQPRENDWDTMKKREIKKKQQPVNNDKPKQADEKRSQKPDKSKERPKKEKSSPPKQVAETRDQLMADSSGKKEEKPVQQEKRSIDAVETNPLQEKKRKQKKKKTDKSGGDEIDKALKEIEDMDKQKAKSLKEKPKEQSREQNKPRESAGETLEKSKDETDKKQGKSGEKSKKSGKSKEATKAKENIPVRQDVLPIKATDQSAPKDNTKVKEGINDVKDLSSTGEEEVRKGSSKEEPKDQSHIADVNSNKPDTKIKHKSKTSKNTKESGESTDGTVQPQASVPSEDLKEKTNIVDENSLTEIVKLSDIPKDELKDTVEKPSMATRTESTTKQKDTSKKEQSSKNKSKSKELRLEAENNDKDQEKLENGIKETLKNISPESNKPLTNPEVRDSKPNALDIAKVVEVNGGVKGKVNSRKKDKASKGKIRTETTADLASPIIPTSEVLNETKVLTSLDNAEKPIVSKSEQIIEETQAIEASATIIQEPGFKEEPKEIVLSSEIVQETEKTVQTDIKHENDKTDETEFKESTESKKQDHRQTDATLGIESATADTRSEKKAVVRNADIEKTEKRETEKRQTKTGKQKKSDKTKSGTQDRDKSRKDDVKVPLPVESENKSTEEEDKLKIESSSKSVIEVTAETFVQPAEKTNLAEENASVSDDSHLIQSKTDAKDTDDVQTDEKEVAADVQVNKHVPETQSKSKKKGKSKDKSKDAQQARNIKSGEPKSKDKTAITDNTQADTPLKADISHITELIETIAIPKVTQSSTTETTTVAKTDATIATELENVVEFVPAAETLLKVSETTTTDIVATKVERENEIVENGKLEHPSQKAIVKDEEIKADTVKDPSIEEPRDTGKKWKDSAPKEKTSKHAKKKKLESTERTIEQTKHSARDKFREKTVSKDDSTTEKEISRPATCPTDQREVEQEKLDENQRLSSEIENTEIQQTRELSEKPVAKAEVDSKLSIGLVDEAEVHGKHDETRNDSPQLSSTGKALIIEKMVTTVTTTTSVPGSAKVKPPDVKSVKSVEILENIPLPKIVGSKVTELITLRPETVEASLTTTYARVSSEVSPVNICPVQSAEQAANSQRVGLTSLASSFAENLVTSDESALFGSVQDRRKVCSEISKDRDISKESPVIAALEEKEEELVAHVDDKTEKRVELVLSSEFVQRGDQSKVKVSEEKSEKDNTMREAISDGTVLQNDNIAQSQNINNFTEENNVTLNREVAENTSNTSIPREEEQRDKEKINVEIVAENIREEKIPIEERCEIKPKDTPEIAKERKQIVPEYLLDLVKPYALDRHAYNHAESNFYRYFKVVRTIKEPQAPAPVVPARPESIVRIVQESVMKPVEQPNQEEPDVSYKRHALFMEAPKYPLASFYEFELHWVRAKSVTEKSLSISSDDTEISHDSVIEKAPQVIEEVKEVTAVPDLEESIIVNNIEELEATEAAEKLEISTPQVEPIAQVPLSNKTLDSSISENKDEKLTGVRQSVHLVSDDSWMSILDEPMVIDDDFDDTPVPGEIKSKETDKILMDVCVNGQDEKGQEKKKEQSSKDISDVEEVSPRDESRNPTSDNALSQETDLVIKTDVPAPISETLVAIDLTKSPVENITDSQLKNDNVITDTNVLEDEVDARDKIEIVEEKSETEAASTATPSVHLESDDAWMALLEEEITLDDDFDLPADQAKEKSTIEKDNNKTENIEQPKEEIDKKAEPKIEVLNKTILTEIAVKDEYLAGIKDIQNEASVDIEKHIDKAKNQSKKKKESKHAKDAKAKDQTKSKAGSKKQNEVEIKSATTESDSLPTQYNLEEIKVKETDIDTMKAEKPLITDEQQADELKLLSEEPTLKQKEQDTIEEAYEKPPKREETKSKSGKKAKKQNEKSEVTQEKTVKRDGKVNDSTPAKDRVKESNVAEVSPVVQKQQDSKDDMPKFDSRLNPNAKSWAAIVGAKGAIETTTVPEDDSVSIQTPSVTSQDTTDGVPSIVEQPQTPVERDSCEISLKPGTHVTAPKKHTSQNAMEESKVSAAEENAKPVVEKSAESSEQLREESKSYAQVAASSRRTSPQTSQEETYLIKPVPLKSDHKVTDVRAPVLDEPCKSTDAEKLQSPSEQEIVPIDEQQTTDRETVIEKFTLQNESIPWIEVVEEEASIASSEPNRAVDSKDTENPCAKPDTSTWAAIVGKKSVDSPEVTNVSSFEQVPRKPDQNVEQRLPTNVQIYVEEAAEQQPIEKLVQVDEQGFMEFVNRKELRSRRSRSRSRGDRRDDGHAVVTVETSDSAKDKEIKTVDLESQSGENVTAKEEVEDENKQPAVKQVDELMKVVKEEDVPKETVKLTKSKDKAKQKKDSNERKKDERKKDKKPAAENSEIQSDESKTVQETKPEQDEAPKGKKAKSKKSKSTKDSMKQQPEIKTQKELKNIEEMIKEDQKPAKESETPDTIQSENTVTASQELKTVEDQSIKETPLIADTEIAQEIKNKDVEALPTMGKSITKSRKKSKNKKGKVASEQPFESAPKAEKEAAGENLEKKVECPVETKLEDEIKIKLEDEITTDVTHNNAPESSESKEISIEKTDKEENVEQQQNMPEKITEQESIEQKAIVDKPENTDDLKESHLENVEESVTEQKEVFKMTKAEKRKQKKRAKASSQSEVTERKEIEPAEENSVQSKPADSSSETNITEEIKGEEIVKLTDGIANTAPSETKIDVASEFKKDDESVTEVQAVQVEKPEKSMEKPEVTNENEASHSQVTPTTDKQKQKGKTKSKKGKRQQDDKTVKSSQEDFTTNALMAVESLPITTNAETLSSSKDVVTLDSRQNKEGNVEDETSLLQVTPMTESSSEIVPPEDKIDTNELPATAVVINQGDAKEPEPLVSSTEKEINEDSVTVNVDESVSADEGKMDKMNLIPKENNEISTQIESSNDSTGTVIKHSPPLDKLSSIAQQSFDDEDKRVASIEQESPSSDVADALPKSKVQFYIADEILVLKPEKRKDVIPPESLLQKRADGDFYRSRFLSIDGGFWPDKRPYHEAERDHFENLALHTKKSLSRDPDDLHRPRDRDDDRDGDNSGGNGGGGRSQDSCGDSRSLLGTPQTERMVADLPGGICSWSDYSTYLSSESERTVDPDGPALGSIEDPTVDSGLSLDYSSPSDVHSPYDLSLPLPSSSSFTHEHPQTESRTELPVDAEVSPRECPAASSSSSLQSPDDPSTSTWPSTFVHLRPRSKLHLGRERREESVQWWNTNGVAERETAQGETERRIRRIQVRSTSHCQCSVLF